GLGGRRTLGIELYQRRLNYRRGRLEFRRHAEGDEQQHGDQHVNAQRLDQRSAEALFVRLYDRSVPLGASVMRPTLGTPDCCSAAIAATTTPQFTSRSPRIYTRVSGRARMILATPSVISSREMAVSVRFSVSTVSPRFQ